MPKWLLMIHHDGDDVVFSYSLVNTDHIKPCCISTGCKAATSQNPTPARTIVLVLNIYMTIIDVDDGDARIMYSYGWTRGGSPPDYNHTISYTTTQGAQFTFVFLGTSVRVFGTLAATTFPNTSYSIDSGEPVLFFGEPPAQMQYRRNFFSSPDLTYGTHTLVGTCVDEGGLVYLDYLEVETPALLITPGPASLPSLSTKSQSSLSGLSSTDSPTTTSPTGPIVSTISPLSPVMITYWGSQPSEVSAASPSIFKSKPTPPAAAIIGGVVGGFALAVITRVLYLRYRRWQSRKFVALIPRRQSFSSFTSLAGSA